MEEHVYQVQSLSSQEIPALEVYPVSFLYLPQSSLRCIRATNEQKITEYWIRTRLFVPGQQATTQNSLATA